MGGPKSQRSISASAAHVDPLLGRVVDGRYSLLSLIGRGGMGTVYKAHQASLERAVAIKVLAAAPTKAREQEFQSRFFLEASTAAKLKHPNTITVFDYGSEVIEDVRLFFIAMEYLEGVTLTKALNDGGLSVAQSVHILLQLTRSLREAHAIGVVHRDLKPGNIMLMKAGDEDDADEHFVKVLDFGLAKTFAGAEDAMNLTRVGTFLGSPRYVSPEQIEGKNVDPRADIYSLGCVMYRMLEGRAPFDGDAPVEVMLKHLNEAVPPMQADIPKELSRLVLDCLLKAPIERPQNMSEVIRRLKLVRSGMGVYSISPDSVDERSSKNTRSKHPTGNHPAPRGARKARSTKDTAPTRAPNASLPPTLPPASQPPVGQVPISEESPRMHSLGYRRKKEKRSLSPLLVAIVVALLVGGGFVVAYELGYLRKAGKARPPAQLNAGRRVKVRVSTAPAEGVTVYEKRADGTKDRLGMAPLTLDWRFQEGAARVLVFTRSGFFPATVDVDPPAALPAGKVFALDVKLVASE